MHPNFAVERCFQIVSLRNGQLKLFVKNPIISIIIIDYWLLLISIIIIDIIIIIDYFDLKLVFFSNFNSKVLAVRVPYERSPAYSSPLCSFRFSKWKKAVVVALRIETLINVHILLIHQLDV